MSGGMSPKAKAVPACVLASKVGVQAKFLRGLFEDGTVNVRDNRLDHVGWTTCYADMAVLVQRMLLRMGIVAKRGLAARQAHTLDAQPTRRNPERVVTSVNVPL